MGRNKSNIGEPPPFKVDDAVVLDPEFGNDIGGKTFVVQACMAHNNCSSGWLVYINEWARPLDSGWFKIKFI